MSPEPEFAPAGPADAAALLPLMAAFYRHLAIPFDPDAAATGLGELLANPAHGRVWLIRLGGEVVGYAAVTVGFSLEFGGLHGVLDELFVTETHRGRGIGTKAIAVAEDYCRGAGLKALVLEVSREDGKAREFYARAGFRDRGHLLLVKIV